MLHLFILILLPYNEEEEEDGGTTTAVDVPTTTADGKRLEFSSLGRFRVVPPLSWGDVVVVVVVVTISVDTAVPPMVASSAVGGEDVVNVSNSLSSIGFVLSCSIILYFRPYIHDAAGFDF